MVGLSHLQGEAALVDVANSVWRRSPQRAAMAVDRLMSLRLVSAEAIVGWVFGSAGVTTLGDESLSGAAWEILYNAINKTIARVQVRAACRRRAPVASCLLQSEPCCQNRGWQTSFWRAATCGFMDRTASWNQAGPFPGAMLLRSVIACNHNALSQPHTQWPLRPSCGGALCTFWQPAQAAVRHVRTRCCRMPERTWRAPRRWWRSCRRRWMR